MALLVTLLQPSTYRASGAVILVRQGQPPGGDPELTRAVLGAQKLLRSRAVADSAVANLKLAGSADDLLDDVRVTAEPETSLIRFSVDAGEREEARRIGQELAEVFTVLYNGRFGPATTASIWETPQARGGRISPRPALNLGLGAALGLAIGAGLAAARRRERRAEPTAGVAAAPSSPPVAPSPPVADSRLQERVAALTARELALARRAATLVLRERELATAVPPQLPAAGTIAASELATSVPEPAAAVLLEPEREPERGPEPIAPFVLPGPGSWTIADVERLLAQEGHAFPDQLEELGFYVGSFRDVAEPGGRLPAGVEIVVEDVFEELIRRSRSASA